MTNSISDSALFKMAFFCYATSWIIPVEGQWFAGAYMFMLSAITSLAMLVVLDASMLIGFKSIFGLLVALMPFFNVIFIFTLFRFRSLSTSQFSVPKMLFHGCTVTSFVVSISGLLHDFKQWYPLALWSLAFILLSMAIIVKTERNLTKRVITPPQTAVGRS